MADKAIVATTDVVRGIQTLLALASEIPQAGGVFDDADFDGTNMQHVNAWKLNTLLGVVAPALKLGAATPIDPAQPDGVKMIDILYAVKRA